MHGAPHRPRDPEVPREENLGALDVVLTSRDLARLDALAPVGVAAGDRYPDMRTVDR